MTTKRKSIRDSGIFIAGAYISIRSTPPASVSRALPHVRNKIISPRRIAMPRRRAAFAYVRQEAKTERAAEKMVA